VLFSWIDFFPWGPALRKPTKLDDNDILRAIEEDERETLRIVMETFVLDDDDLMRRFLILEKF